MHINQQQTSQCETCDFKRAMIIIASHKTQKNRLVPE